MAWTTSKAAEYPAGNHRVQLWDLTADSATLELSTGLKNIVSVQWSIKSVTSAGIKFKGNILSAGTASYGSVAITGAASGDNLYLMVVGN